MTIALPTPDIRSLRFVPLVDRAILTDFESGEAEIDRNLQKCCDWHEAHRAKTFCAMMETVTQAYGFYSLGVIAQDPKGMDADVVRAGEGRKFVPFIYIHYIAVRKEFQNLKVGTMLLGDMLHRCMSVVNNVGIFGLALNALTPRAAELYHKYGFRQRNETQYPLMILPSQTLIDLATGG